MFPQESPHVIGSPTKMVFSDDAEPFLLSRYELSAFFHKEVDESVEPRSQGVYSSKQSEHLGIAKRATTEDAVEQSCRSRFSTANLA